MSSSNATCWTVIRGAAAGGAEDREEFARRYVPVIRAYLGARWRHSSLIEEIDDAVQEVFLDCFKPDGALARADPSRAGGFRPFFYGVIRNVGLRAERKLARRREHPPDSSLEVEADDPGLSSVFDRAWATAVLQEAGARQTEFAEERGEAARRRVELLQLRFQESLSIREIALRWNADPVHLHHEYAKAREEFRDALVEVVSFHHPGTRGEVERESARLLDLFK